MSSPNTSVLSDKDVNAAPAAQAKLEGKADVKSMEYHRQVLQSKLEESQGKPTYVSPSDNIMSPCTAKLSAYRNKQVGKAKPKSLFAKTSSKNLGTSAGLFGKEISTQSEEKKLDGQ